MDNSFGANALEVLKWVGIVFAAGFVGYFGRYLAKLLIARNDKRKGVETIVRPSLDTPPVSNNTATTDDDYKLEKKRLKADSKKTKKAVKE